jgi:hypothetical protein
MFPMESNFLLIWKWSPCKIGTEIYALNRAQTLIACELCGSQAGLQKYHWYQEILVIASCCPTSRAASTWDPQDPRNHLYRLCPALLDRLVSKMDALLPFPVCVALCFASSGCCLCFIYRNINRMVVGDDSWPCIHCFLKKKKFCTIRLRQIKFLPKTCIKCWSLISTGPLPQPLIGAPLYSWVVDSATKACKKHENQCSHAMLTI